MLSKMSKSKLEITPYGEIGTLKATEEPSCEWSILFNNSPTFHRTSL
jgi:hypothetical protein